MDQGEGVKAQSDDQRLGVRNEVLLAARCRHSPWLVKTIEIVNLSCGGCCLASGSRRVAQGDVLSLRIADLEPMFAQVCWVSPTRCGVAFSEPLDPDVVVRLSREFAIPLGDKDEAQRRAQP